MSDETEKNSFLTLPDEIKNLISTEKGRGIVKYLHDNPDLFRTVSKMDELHKKVALLIKDDPQIQNTILQISKQVLGNHQKSLDLFKAQKAAESAALSGTVGDFKSHVADVKHSQQAWGLGKETLDETEMCKISELAGGYAP